MRKLFLLLVFGAVFAGMLRADFKIVPKAELSASEACVLDDVQGLLARALGYDIRVVTVTNAPPQQRIFFGIAPQGETLADFRLGEHAVTTRDGDVYLYGKGPNGTRYAAYDFLQDDLGFRFFDARGGVKIPDLSRLVLTNGMRRVVYSFDDRMIPYWHVKKESAATFYARNGINRPGAASLPNRKGGRTGLPPGYQMPFPGCHGLVIYLPRNGNSSRLDVARKICGENLEKEHPEYFSVNAAGKRVFDHQRCLANPAARVLLKKVLLAHAANQKYPSYIDLSAGDTGGHFCFCEGCKALERKYGTPGGPLLDFILEFAPEMAKKYPQHKILMLAYRKDQTQHPPKNLAKMPDNFVPFFAPIDDDFSKDWTSPVNAETLADLRAWGRLCRNVFMWYYSNPYAGGAEVPFGNVTRLVNDFRLAHAASSRSMACQHDVGLKRLSGFTELQSYVILRLLRDVTLEERTLVAEFCDFEYGAASQGVQAYLQELEDIRKTTKLDFPWDPPASKFTYMTPARMKTWNAAFDWMENLVAANQTYLRNLRRVRLPLDLSLVRTDVKLVPEASSRAKAIAREIAEDAFDPSLREKEGLGTVRAIDKSLFLAEIKQGKVVKPLPADIFGAYKPEQIFTTLPLAHSGKFVDDPDAAFGKASVFDDSVNAPRQLKLPFCGYISTEPHFQIEQRDLPKDGGYKIYDLGRGVITEKTTLTMPTTWFGFKAELAFAHIAGTFNRVRYFASLKFEGPAYYPDQSACKNRILCDRFIIIHEE